MSLVPSTSLAAHCCIAVIKLPAHITLLNAAVTSFPSMHTCAHARTGSCHANSGTGAASFTQESAHLLEWSPPSLSAATLPDMEVTCGCKIVGVREKSVFSNNQSRSVPKDMHAHKHTSACRHIESIFRGSIKKPETQELVCCQVFSTFRTNIKERQFSTLPNWNLIETIDYCQEMPFIVLYFPPTVLHRNVLKQSNKAIKSNYHFTPDTRLMRRPVQSL